MNTLNNLNMNARLVTFCTALVLLLSASSARAQLELAILDSNPRVIPIERDADSIDVTLYIRNFTASAITRPITLYQTSNDYLFAIIGSDTLHVRANEYSEIKVRFYNYSKTGYGQALLSIGSGVRDSVTLSVQPADSIRERGIGPKLHNNRRAFEYAVPGVKECQRNELSNLNANDMTVTAIRFSHPNYSVESITFPAIIPARQGRIAFDICFEADPAIPPMARVHTEILIDYIDQQGNPRTEITDYTAFVAGCIAATEDSLYMEPTIVGGWVEAMTTITNTSQASVDLTAQVLERPRYGETTIVNNPFPTSLAPGTSIDVVIRLKSTQEGLNYGFVVIKEGEDSSSCGGVSIQAWGYAKLATEDTMSLDLFPAQKETLVMQGEAEATTRTFYFHNNTGSALKVVSVALNTGEHFRIVSMSPSPTPFDLQPNQILTLELEFDADEDGLYRDSLVIVTDNALQGLVFGIHGLQANATASVSRGQQTSVRLQISSNPATGPVTISATGAHSIRYEVIDLLGNRIITSDQSSFVWTGTSEAGQVLPNGAYIIRASGLDDQNRPFVVSQQLMLQR